MTMKSLYTYLKVPENASRHEKDDAGLLGGIRNASKYPGKVNY
jgi:hypothetical protein